MSNKKWRTPANPPAIDVSTEPAARGSDAAAREMLLQNAEFLHEFVQDARAALKRLPVEMLEAILKQAEPEPEAADENFRKRPRGSAHPILQIQKLAVGAVRLLTRVLRATNPGVFARTPDEMDLWALAKESDGYLERLRKQAARTATGG